MSDSCLYHYGVKGMKWHQHKARSEEPEKRPTMGASSSSNGQPHDPTYSNNLISRWVYQHNVVRTAGSAKVSQNKNKNKGRARRVVNRNRTVRLNNAKNAQYVSSGRKIITGQFIKRKGLNHGN